MPVLIVDDDGDLQDTICDTLVGGGHAAVCVSNGHQALDSLQLSARRDFGKTENRQLTTDN
jgi:CheY-like chemotaxis protein